MIEVVYYSHFCIYRDEFSSVESALSFIEHGEWEGTMSSVGVFRDGEPIIYGGFTEREPPTDTQAEKMREDYAQAS